MRVYGAGSLISSATLTLTPFADQSCPVPEIRSTSAMYQGGSGPHRVSKAEKLSQLPAFLQSARI